MSEAPVPLDEALDESRFGGKAVQLGAALRAGLPVPDGVALSWDLVDAVAAGDDESSRIVAVAFERLGGAIAVRSSAVGEDSKDASFAGVHLSVLNVRDVAGVIDAVRDVWKSARSESALAYRASRVAGAIEPRIGVVMQRLVEPDCAGVLFTRHPITHADERVIEAAWGLGEVVVGGLVTPDHLRLAPDGTLLEMRIGEKDIMLRTSVTGGTEEVAVASERVLARCLSDGQAHALVALGARCETLLGRPADIEWAFAGGQMFLLQQRPINDVSGTQESAAAPRGMRLTAAFALASALIPLGSTMLAVVSPQIAESFGVDATTLTPWLVLSYLTIAIVGQGPGGRLGDAMGHARALAAGQACCALGALAGALAPHVAVVVAARVLMAAGGAVMLPAAMALLRDTTRPERRARTFGWFGAIMSLAAAIGPLVGGEIAALFGWRATFTAQLVPLLLSVLLARGATFGARTLTEAADGARQRISLLALFRVRTFASGSIVTALQNCAMYGVLHQLPLLFGALLGEDEAPIGRALVVMTGGMVVLSPLGGMLAERLGARVVVVIGSLLSTLGVLLLVDVAALDHASDTWLGLALLGAGVGLTSGPAQASALSEVPGNASGYAAGILSTTRYVGGVAAMAFLLPLRAGHGSLSSALSLHSHVLVAFACSTALAGVMALALPGRTRRATTA